jgi:hypothetical protein
MNESLPLEKKMIEVVLELEKKKAHPYHVVERYNTETDSAWDLHFVSSLCQAGRRIHN